MRVNGVSTMVRHQIGKHHPLIEHPAVEFHVITDHRKQAITYGGETVLEPSRAPATAEIQSVLPGLEAVREHAESRARGAHIARRVVTGGLICAEEFLNPRREAEP